MSKYFEFELKPQQERAFKALTEFTENSTSDVFILKGYAGTGKTTLMSGFINWLNSRKIHSKLLASTGRAAKILSDKTVREAFTIHSHIYKFKDIDDDLEEVEKKQTQLDADATGQLNLLFDLAEIKTSETIVYIIDEASMISDKKHNNSSFAKFGSGELLKDLFEFNKTGKFIFVGDPCQLPPVGQMLSPALSKEYIESKYHKKTTAIELTQIIRQAAENGIVKASMKLRKLQKENPRVKFAMLPFKNHNNIDIQNSHISLIDNYINCIKQNNFEYATLICQTNRHCANINHVIRKSLGRSSNRPEKNDLLLVTQNNYIVDLVNGDMVKVLQTGFTEYRCGLTFLQVQVQELASKEIKDILLIEDILHAMATNLNSKQHNDLMIDFYKRMKALGIEQKTDEFKKNMMSDPYLNALKAVYGYAITCHKSQGGEWNEVFLYLDNKIHGIPKPSIYQWIYTATTRAKETLHIVNDWFIK